MSVLCLQVFHCVHFECPADSSTGNLLQSVSSASSSGVSSSITSGPLHSPGLNRSTSAADRASLGTPLPMFCHEEQSLQRCTGGGNGLGMMGAGAQTAGGAGAMAELLHTHHRHSSTSSHASSSSNNLELPSPRLMNMDMYARPESQQDVPEADRIDAQWGLGMSDCPQDVAFVGTAEGFVSWLWTAAALVWWHEIEIKIGMHTRILQLETDEPM